MNIGSILRKNPISIALILLILLFSFLSSNFLTVGNFNNIIIQSSITMILVVSFTMLVIGGYVDLSVGSTVALSGVVTSLAIIDYGLSPFLAILLGILSGCLIGSINGLLCGVWGLNPIIVTLGMLSVVRGATLLLSSSALFGLGPTFEYIGQGKIMGIPILVLIALVIVIIGFVVLYYTPWGRYIYAVGINPRAAYLAGIPRKKLSFSLFFATGFAAGLAGVLYSARLNGAAPADLGQSMELFVLTAVLVGGVAFAGGRGSLYGAIVAVLVLGVLENGLVLLGISSFVQLVLEGSVLIIAAILDLLGSRTTGRKGILERFFPLFKAKDE